MAGKSKRVLSLIFTASPFMESILLEGNLPATLYPNGYIEQDYFATHICPRRFELISFELKLILWISWCPSSDEDGLTTNENFCGISPLLSFRVTQPISRGCGE